MAEGNILMHGDKLDPSRRHRRDESVDLVHLDPRNEGNVAEYGLGGLDSHPVGRRVPKMAKSYEIEIR